MSSTNKWHRRAFYVMGALSASLIVWQGLRTQYSQEKSSADILASEQEFKSLLLSQEQKTRDAINKPSTHEPPPDIALTFIEPTDVSVVMFNPSSEVVREPKWWCVITDVDAPPELGKFPYQPLLIPAWRGDFLRPHSRFVPSALVSLYPAVSNKVKTNDRVFGYVAASCPLCIRDRFYWVYFVYGVGGWYSEIKGQPADSSLFQLVLALSKDKQSSVLDGLVPVQKRIPIAPV